MTGLFDSERRQNITECCYKVATQADKILVCLFLAGTFAGMVDQVESCESVFPANATATIIPADTNTGYSEEVNCIPTMSSMILTYASIIGLIASGLWSLWRMEKVRDTIKRGLGMPVDVEMGMTPLIGS